jgi:thiamine-monophosphate kinase
VSSQPKLPAHVSSIDDDPILGEESLIQGFLAPLAAGYPGALGLQDDCALLAPVPGTELVLKTDPVSAGVHFFPDDAPEDIAWKALAVNVSDLAAKGAEPVAYLMALALPKAPERAWMRRFADGLGVAQRTFGCHLIGGDTDRTKGPLTISITVIGSVPAGGMVRRATAQAGDLLYVTGTIGDAALGLRLRQDRKLGGKLGLVSGDIDYLVQRYLRPRPALALRVPLRAHASAAMDLSDGLVKDLERMCAASGVAARIQAVHVPLSAPARAAVNANRSLLPDLLTGGDDYEVLMAVPLAARSAFEAQTGLSAIGEVMAGQGVTVLDERGNPLTFPRTGWDHFP